MPARIGADTSELLVGESDAVAEPDQCGALVVAPGDGSLHRVYPGAVVERVVVVPANEVVVCFVSLEGVPAAESVDHIVASVAPDDIVATPVQMNVAKRVALDDVRSRGADGVFERRRQPR